MSTRRVVIADEDPSLRRLLAERLEWEGFDVRVVDKLCVPGESQDDFDADAVVSEISDHGPALRQVRERSDVLFVAMMPRSTPVMDALDVVEAGADDVLVKPFLPRELVTRMRALLRRSAAPVAVPVPVLEFDGLTIDVAARDVRVDGESVELPAREFDLLAFLASSPRQAFSRREIMAAVWSVDDGFGAATVTEHVRRVRARIEPDPSQPRWIQTVRSVGYRFSP